MEVDAFRSDLLAIVVDIADSNDLPRRFLECETSAPVGSTPAKFPAVAPDCYYFYTPFLSFLKSKYFWWMF